MIPETHKSLQEEHVPFILKRLQENSMGMDEAVGAWGGCFKVWDGVLMSESSSESQNKPTIVQPCSLKL